MTTAERFNRIMSRLNGITESEMTARGEVTKKELVSYYSSLKPEFNIFNNNSKKVLTFS